MRRVLYAITALVFLFSVTTASAAEYKKMTIRAATANPEGSLHTTAINKFKEIVEKESGGQITVQTFYGGSMGDEQSNVRQLRSQEIHLAVLAVGNLTPFAAQANIFYLPYMFPKIDAAYALLGHDDFKKKVAHNRRLPPPHQLQAPHRQDRRPAGPEDPRPPRGRAA